MSEAQRHRDTAARFTQLVDGATDWDAPAPVEGWTARDVVGHLTTWLPAFLQGAGISMAPVPADPVGAWHAHVDQVQTILEDPTTPGRVLSNPHTGEMPLATAIDRIYTTDVFMHTWDLARSTGQDDTLDPQACAGLLAGMTPIEQMLRDSGQYGPRVAVAADADPQTQLIGFLGRDPNWSSPSAGSREPSPLGG